MRTEKEDSGIGIFAVLALIALVAISWGLAELESKMLDRTKHPSQLNEMSNDRKIIVDPMVGEFKVYPVTKVFIKGSY